MKYLITLYLLSTSILSHGQAISVAMPATIKTTKTTAYTHIRSTKVFLIAPQGFTPSQDLPAVEKAPDGVIEAAEFLDTTFSSDTARFNRKGLETPGFHVLDYKELTLNGYPTRLALLQGNDGTRTYRLLFGDTSFHVVIIDHTAVVMQGQAGSNFSTYLQDFKALSSTIRKK